MKILLISPLPPPSGGIATWTLGYKEWCVDKNITVDIVNTAVAKKRVKDFSSFSILSEIKRTFSIINNVKKALKNGYDIVHINSSCGRNGLVRDSYIAKLAKKKGMRVVLHCHCDVEAQAVGRTAIRLLKRVAKTVNKIIVLNNSSKLYISKKCNAQAVIISNFISRVDFIQKINRETISNALFVGHILKSKGAVEIIEVAKQLPHINFNFIGNLSQKIAKIAVTSNVHYLGEKSREEVIKNMRDSDVLIMPTYTEGFPGVILEAMSTGLPIITTPVGAIPDMVEGKAGVMVPVQNVEAIVKAFDEISDLSTRQQMSNFGLEKAKTVYDIDVVMAQYMNLYNEVIND